MAQFDVHPNPIPAARRAYPYVVILQSELAALGRDQIVAPLVPRAALAPIAGRLTPAVSLQAREFVALVPALTSVRRSDLGTPMASLAQSRIELLAAIDFLFSGV
jgi:toxin CcdB